jgi:hypothetical protein
MQRMSKLKFLLTTLLRLIKNTNFLKTSYEPFSFSSRSLLQRARFKYHSNRWQIIMSSYKGTEPPSLIDIICILIQVILRVQNYRSRKVG